MIFLQTLVLPEAVPPATPIKKGEGRARVAALTPLPTGLGVEEVKAEPLNFVGDEGGVNGGESSKLISCQMLVWR